MPITKMLMPLHSPMCFLNIPIDIGYHSRQELTIWRQTDDKNIFWFPSFHNEDHSFTYISFPQQDSLSDQSCVLNIPYGQSSAKLHVIMSSCPYFIMSSKIKCIFISLFHCFCLHQPAGQTVPLMWLSIHGSWLVTLETDSRKLINFQTFWNFFKDLPYLWSSSPGIHTGIGPTCSLTAGCRGDDPFDSASNEGSKWFHNLREGLY